MNIFEYAKMRRMFGSSSGGASSGGGENRLNQMLTKTITEVTEEDLRGVTKIVNNAFSMCENLTSVVIPDSITSIGDSAFYKCSKLTSVTIGKGVTSCAGYSFAYCSGLKEVHISDIEAWCKISFSPEANPLNKAKNLYLNGQPVTNLEIPNTITSLNDDVFGVCVTLTNVIIPDSVTTIGMSAFNNCTELTHVTVGSGVTSIGGSAFYNLSKLQKFKIYATTPPTIQSSTFYSINNFSIEVPAESVEAYKTATNWSRYASRIVAIEE